MAVSLRIKSVPKPLVALVCLVLGGTILFVGVKRRADDLLTLSLRLSKRLVTATGAKDVSFTLAVTLAKTGEYRAAKTIFEDLLMAEPTNLSVINNLAYVTGELGDVETAAEYLRTALQVSGDCAECLNNLGSLLVRQGKPNEAREYFERAAKLAPGFVDPPLNLGVVLEGVSDWAGALEWYGKAEPLVRDTELKKWVASRIQWMNEITASRGAGGKR